MRKTAFLIFLAAFTFGISQCTSNSQEVSEIGEGGELVYPKNEKETTSDNQFANWDQNNNSQLESEEFYKGMRAGNYWHDWEWDLDADDEINEQEWRTELFSIGDNDENAWWNESEWTKFEKEFKTGWAWENIDANGDGELIESEWEAAWNKNRWFDQWDSDSDGFISEEEYYSLNYALYDDNNDGWWNQTEYKDFEESWELN